MEEEGLSREDAEEKHDSDPKREMDLFRAQRAVDDARTRGSREQKSDVRSFATQAMRK